MTAINLTELFEIQRKLDAEIERKHPVSAGERIYKINLALLVELGECANEWRGFKFWSNRQTANVLYQTTCDPAYATHHYCEDCKEDVANKDTLKHFKKCEGVLYPMKAKNPLLEEYVDCLHFILSIGNFINYEQKDFPVGRFYREKTIEEQFLLVFEQAVNMKNDDYYYELVQSFMRLGEMLGFTWEQIETAYMSKNAINHQRQAEGY